MTRRIDAASPAAARTARENRHGIAAMRIRRWPCWLFAVLLGASAAAQEFTPDQPAVFVAQGHDVVVMPSATASMRMESEFGPIQGRSFVSGSGRVHVVTFEGETFRASTPMEGPNSRIVFDPSQRKFAQLLPSIRLELEDYASLESIASLIGATNATAFESLGFAIIELPETLHPVEAIQMLGSHPEQPQATLRIRGPQIEWR